MKATCPANKKHNQFTTVAHVMEEWLVDDAGNFIKVSASLQTTHGPDAENIWTCAVCGAEAEVK